jgi:REP element-mobilizing transposase RayT
MRSRYKVTENNGIYFVTSTVVEWIPVFTSKIYFEIIIDSLKFCRTNKGLKLYAFVIVDNHFHLIVSGERLAEIMRSLKGFTSRQIIEQLKRDNKKWLLNQLAYYKKRHKTESTFQVWQEGFHPELILSEEMLVQKIEYIHFNPVKRGYVNLPEQWRYSSARNFILEDQSIIEIDLLPV